MLARQYRLDRRQGRGRPAHADPRDRRLLSAALDGSLHKAVFRTDPHFGLEVPEQVPGVETHILDPIRTWRSKGEFAETAGRLVQMFRDNFKKFEDHTDEHVRSAAPAPRIALA